MLIPLASVTHFSLGVSVVLLLGWETPDAAAVLGSSTRKSSTASLDRIKMRQGG